MTKQGLILKGIGGNYEVLVEDGTKMVCRARGALRHERLSPLPGDRVLCSPQENGFVIEQILPRKNVLVRPRMANVDLIFLVLAAAPEPDLFACDKLTAIAEHLGIEVVILINKADLADASVLAGQYASIGYETRLISACDPRTSLEDILTKVRGKIACLMGNSGVGKSTILSRLFPEQEIRTGQVSQRSQRGRHTTRTVELYAVQNGFLADTPGFSLVELEEFSFLDKQQLPAAFREFSPYVEQCLFHDCSHTSEKGCAVRRAVEEGKILARRHENYCRLYEQLRGYKEWQTKK
ncbi:MAG: ribosome small subunit-dependent GTPase A [Clostridia bacterium]|nr:ribosome small subunit-dependent GTPase A [Clostridia bacterium]